MHVKAQAGLSTMNTPHTVTCAHTSAASADIVRFASVHTSHAGDLRVDRSAKRELDVRLDANRMQVAWDLGVQCRLISPAR